MSTTLIPVSCLIEKVPPMAIVISAARSVPTASSGKPMSASARLNKPSSAPGNDGDAAGASGLSASTRAATRAFNSGVSPGKATNVPVD